MSDEKKKESWLSKNMWYIIIGLVILIGVGAIFLLRQSPPPTQGVSLNANTEQAIKSLREYVDQGSADQMNANTLRAVDSILSHGSLTNSNIGQLKGLLSKW